MSMASDPRPVRRRSNVVLFGEPGVGKSAVINLIMGLHHDVAKTSAAFTPCTLDARPYDITIQGRDFRIFEAPCLVEPQSLGDPDYFIVATAKAYRLVRYLSDTGGINLLLFCMQRGRITVTGQQIYELFHDVLCHKKVPIVLVVTHLEHEVNMEDWWSCNHSHFTECGIHVVDHACITARREFSDRYHASRQVVHDLLVAHGCGVGFLQERVLWETELLQKLLDLDLDFSTRMDSLQKRAQKLRGYGLREDEIATLMVKIHQAGKDTATVRPVRGHQNARARIHTATAIVTAGENDNPSTTNPNPDASGSLQDEAPNLDHERNFPNDLTSHVTREGYDPVASGGFADIHRGTLRSNAMPIKVAIKAIKTYSGEDDVPKKQKRLRREIKVWLSLKHDNVLPLLGITMGFGRFPAMVCPWAENGTLTSYLARHVSLSVYEIFGLLHNVASGLQYLHSRSVVHGDLSGSNILICENGRAYIADFGLSTLLTELGGATFATSFHARGTIRWMAPELLDLRVPENELEGEASHVLPTTYSDVYSFGGVMLQILSGKVPYHYYAREMQVVHAVSRGVTPKRPSVALVTERRWTFIERCWSAVDIARTRPSSEQIVDFTRNELGSVNAS